MNTAIVVLVRLVASVVVGIVFVLQVLRPLVTLWIYLTQVRIADATLAAAGHPRRRPRPAPVPRAEPPALPPAELNGGAAAALMGVVPAAPPANLAKVERLIEDEMELSVSVLRRWLEEA